MGFWCNLIDNLESESSDSSSSSDDSSDGSNKCTSGELGYIWLNIMTCQTLYGGNLNKKNYK